MKQKDPLQVYAERLYQEQESLVRVLRPFAIAAPTVGHDWVALSDSKKSKEPHIVLTYTDLEKADEALRRLGLFYPFYEKRDSAN